MDARPGQGHTSSFIPREWNTASAPSTSCNKKDSSVLSAGKGNSTQSLVGMSKYRYSEGVQVDVQTLNYTTEFGLAVRGMHTPAVPLSSTEDKEANGQYRGEGRGQDRGEEGGRDKGEEGGQDRGGGLKEAQTR